MILQGFMARRLAFASACWLSLACSDPEPKPPAEGGAGTATEGGSGPLGNGGSAADPEPGAGGASGSTAEAPCNSLELGDTPPYALGYNSKPHNLPEGGVIPDGTYVIAAQIMFETESGPELELGRTKVTIAGDSWQEVSGDAEPGGVNPDRRSTSTMSLSGATLELTRTCPSEGAPESSEYQVDDSGFTVYVTDAGKSFGTLFTRQ